MGSAAYLGGATKHGWIKYKSNSNRNYVGQAQVYSRLQLLSDFPSLGASSQQGDSDLLV